MDEIRYDFSLIRASKIPSFYKKTTIGKPKRKLKKTNEIIKRRNYGTQSQTSKSNLHSRPYWSSVCWPSGPDSWSSSFSIAVTTTKDIDILGLSNLDSRSQILILKTVKLKLHILTQTVHEVSSLNISHHKFPQNFQSCQWESESQQAKTTRIA